MNMISMYSNWQEVHLQSPDMQVASFHDPAPVPRAGLRVQVETAVNMTAHIRR